MHGLQLELGWVKIGMKKVLHVLSSRSYSGAEHVVISIIRNMPNDIESVYASPDGSIRDRLEAEGIRFFPLRKVCVSEIRRVVRLISPDVIHAHDYRASVVCSLSGVSVPVISHLHNNPPWLKTYHPFSFLYLLASMRFKKVLGVSNAIFDEYVFGHLIAQKSMVISNPIDVENIVERARIGEKSSRSYDIVFIGRLSPEKNPLRFLELMAKVVAQYPHVAIAMIGEGPLKAKCQVAILERNLSRNVELLGFVHNPMGILANSKVLCMTSDWEGFGLVAAEALALGIPVVATAVGGLSEIINPTCGCLTSDATEYVNEVLRLLCDDDYWNCKSDKARGRALQLHNVDKYTKQLYELYRQL